MTKQTNQTPKLSLAERNRQRCTMLNLIFSLIAMLLPLLPSSLVQSNNGNNTLYNMLGAMNQDIGSAATRDSAFPLVILWFIATVLMVVGCVGIYHKLRTAMFFTMAAGVLYVVFVWRWFNVDVQTPRAAGAGSAMRNAYEGSLMPFMLLIVAVAAVVTAVLALLNSGTATSKKPVKFSR